MLNYIDITSKNNQENNPNHTAKKQNQPILYKYNSEPKFTTLKQEILKIPKVKQILQKDKLVYSQDIEKRLELLGSVKNENYEEKNIMELHDLTKKV